MKKIILMLSIITVFLISCSKGKTDYISNIDVNIDFLRLDYKQNGNEEINNFQVVGNELYYSVNVPNENREQNYHSRTTSLNKVNLETNEIVKVKEFDENTFEYVTSFIVKGEAMYYTTMKVSDDFEQQNPFEFRVYVENGGEPQCIDSGYLYAADLSPILADVNDGIYYSTQDLKIDDTLLGTGQYGFKLMNIAKDTAVEIFSSYSPMIEFEFDNDVYERLIGSSLMYSGKYLTFKTGLKSETYNYVYNTETEEMEYINIGHNIESVGMLNNQLLLVNFKDYNKFAVDSMKYELLDVETKERSDCGESLYLSSITLSNDVIIVHQEMKPSSALYINKNGEMQLVPIKDAEVSDIAGRHVIPVSETSFLVDKTDYDYIVTLDVKY